MKTEVETNPHLSVKPKFIFHAEQYLTQSTTFAKQRYKERMGFLTIVPGGANGSASNVIAP